MRRVRPLQPGLVDFKSSGELLDAPGLPSVTLGGVLLAWNHGKAAKGFESTRLACGGRSRFGRRPGVPPRSRSGFTKSRLPRAVGRSSGKRGPCEGAVVEWWPPHLQCSTRPDHDARCTQVGGGNGCRRLATHFKGPAAAAAAGRGRAARRSTGFASLRQRERAIDMRPPP